MTKNTTIAAAVATLLIAGGAVLAGEEVEQNDPYGNGNWRPQAPLQLGSEIDQSDPYGNGNWTAHAPLRQGSEIDQNDPGNGTWTAQPPLRLDRRERRTRMNVGQLLCNNRVVRMIFDARDIELDCP